MHTVTAVTYRLHYKVKVSMLFTYGLRQFKLHRDVTKRCNRLVPWPKKFGGRDNITRAIAN